MEAPRIQVFTYKAGLLAKLGEDLEFALTGFQLELDAGEIRGRFQLSSLRVEGAIRRGRLDVGALATKDRREIERVVASEVLVAREHPEAILEARLVARVGDRFQVRGALTLRGQSRPIEFELEGGPVVSGSFELTPSRWGIAPHRAFGGALKLQDRVGVRVALPVDVANFEGDAWRTARCAWSSSESSPESSATERGQNA
jgi:hypothetical protein